MVYKALGFSFLFLTLSFAGFSQKHTISGQIKDGSNGEDLPYTKVIIKEVSGLGAISNEYGFYSISVPEGEYTVIFKSMGFKTIEKPVSLTEDLVLNIELPLLSEMQEIQEVTVSAEREGENLEDVSGSVTKLDMKEVKLLPNFGGEPDVVKVMSLNPGIKTAGEGNAGFYVRGGGLDQNLVLLDETPIYNPAHILGIFSVFNGDALKGAKLYKGGMLPEYGGRASSVMDLRMKEGNMKKFGMSGGIGLISSRLLLEGPIVKDKASFMVSGRGSYAGAYLKLMSNDRIRNSSFGFYDINAKMNYRINDNNRIMISGYTGRDNIGYRNTFAMDWGNTALSLRWNHKYSSKLISNTSVMYAHYDYQMKLGEENAQFGLESVLDDIIFKHGFTYFANSKNTMKFGVNLTHHEIQPGNLTVSEGLSVDPRRVHPRYGIEGAIYVQNEQKIGSKINLGYGVRYSFLSQMGSGTKYELNQYGEEISSTEYKRWEQMHFYHGLEPRLNASFLVGKNSSIKALYNRNYQYVQLISGTSTANPTDVWVLSNNNIKPQIADQVSLGYFQNFGKGMYEASVETYYKRMHNVIDYKNGANVLFNDLLEGELVSGKGESYGIEFFLKKRKGKFTGWLSYTLSRTTKQFDEINGGEKFSARQDRTHDISLVAIYKVSDRLSVSGNFVYYTGDAVTFPVGKYSVDGMLVPYYTERNGYRMPDYHRLDLGMTWENKKKKNYESSWTFSIYNVYGRENAYSINFEQSEQNPAVTEAVQLALFRWVPSVTYNFKF